MKKALKNKGFTFLEIIIATMILSLTVAGSMVLITRVYTGILSTNLKTYSFNLATENIEIMKSYTFGALPVTADSLLPAEPLSKLEVDDMTQNPWGNPADPDNIVCFGGAPSSTTCTGIAMKVYKIVQWAVEDETGQIVSMKESDLPENYEKNLKSLRVVVEYRMKMGNSMVNKYTELTSYISNAEGAFSGTTIKGYVAKMDRQCLQDGQSCSGDDAYTRNTCRCFPPGHMADVTVYIEGHPEYTAKTNTDSTSPEYGMYTLRNVLPGTYNIYGIGEGYDRGEYTGNPLEVKIGDTELLGINITTPMDNSVEINGDVYYNSAKVNPAAYKTTKVWAMDGRSLPTKVAADGSYLISNVNKDVGTTTVYAILIDTANQVYFGSAVTGNLNGGDTVDITVTMSPSTTGSVTVYALDARYRATPVTAANITMMNLASLTPIPTVTDTNGAGIYVNIPLGRYRLTAAKNCYSVEKTGEIYRYIDVVPNSPEEKIYLFPAGSISGTITEEITGNAPAVPINIQAFSSNKKVAEAYSNTTTGEYLLENVYAGTQGSVRIYYNDNEYTAVSPENGALTGINVSQCGTSTNNNFTIRLSYDTIKGSVEMAGIPQEAVNSGVIIIMQPSTNTRMPHEYRLDSTDADKKRQNALSRRSYPFYGGTAKRNGRYEVLVPRGENYDIYAYFSTVTYSADTDMKGTVLNYYKKISNVSPGSDGQNFSGSWTQY